MELENILERTSVGRMVYLQNGGILGRPIGTNEGDSNFINKPKNKKALEYLKKGRPLREIGKILEMSTKTVMKVKKVAIKLEMI